jgi:hypothetical protein
MVFLSNNGVQKSPITKNTVNSMPIQVAVDDGGSSGSSGIGCTKAELYYLNVGKAVVVCGKTVKLLDVATSAVVVNVDGVIGSASVGVVKTINGLNFKLQDAFSSDNVTQRSANVWIGPVGSINTTRTSPYTTIMLNPNDASSGVTGNAFCVNHGYSGCVTIQGSVTTLYFASTNSTCEGVQSVSPNPYLHDCSQNLISSQSGCLKLVNLVVYNTEPMGGDIRTLSVDQNIVCSK